MATWKMLSEAESQMIRKMAGEGYSATLIAEAMNREFGTARTRNSVIGHKHRKGIKTVSSGQAVRMARVNARRTPPGPKPVRKIAPKVQRTVAPRPALSVVVPEPVYQPRPVSFINAGIDHCKYICGDPVDCARDDFLCGAERRRDDDGNYNSPYCAHHHNLCYLPSTARKSGWRGEGGRSTLKFAAR